MARKYTGFGLKAIAVEACNSLARLDADRLESLAFYCEELITGAEMRVLSAADKAEIDRGTAIFDRTLAATRVNLQVIRRLRAVKDGEPECDPAPIAGNQYAESEYGVH